MSRTYDSARNCGGCRFWSEMIAKAEGGGPVQAMCLGVGAHYIEYTTASMKCEAWQSGHLGAIDDPTERPGRYASGEAA